MFVIMTHCQYTSGGYQNRFRYNGKWFTMGVDRGKHLIKDKCFARFGYSWMKIKKALPQLSQFDQDITMMLGPTNTRIIKRIAKLQGIETQIESDYPTDINSTERLVDICTHYGAKTYLSGPSGAKYLDIELFHRAGIDVTFQEPSESKPIIDLL